MTTRPDNDSRQLRNWYRVSVDTLRGIAVGALILVLAAACYVGYLAVRTALVRDAAAAVIDEARILLRRTDDEPRVQQSPDQIRTAWSNLEQARTHYAEAEYEVAREKGRASRDLLRSLLERAEARREAGEAQFVSIEGRVEYRRGERGPWRAAENRVKLHTGDYVKTAPNASAEVMFVDGTLYTVRSSTLFLVSAAAVGSPSERSIELQYGWVNLNTAQQESRVGTPRAEARVDDESMASVSYDDQLQLSSFAAYRGGIDVTGDDGSRRRVETLEVVTQRDGEMSEPRRLPRAPTPLAPPTNARFDIDEQRQLVLNWESVPDASGYALQVSRKRLFVDNVIDVENRESTEATLGIQGEGTFIWRVAAVVDERRRGPWSEPARFRISSAAGPDAGAVDVEPPRLQIDDVQAYGPIFIVEGTTEPGAAVWVNGESVGVEADGSFTKTTQLAQEGWGFIDVVARDAWGNEATGQRRVFVTGI